MSEYLGITCKEASSIATFRTEQATSLKIDIAKTPQNRLGRFVVLGLFAFNFLNFPEMHHMRCITDGNGTSICGVERPSETFDHRLIVQTNGVDVSNNIEVTPETTITGNQPFQTLKEAIATVKLMIAAGE